MRLASPARPMVVPEPSAPTAAGLPAPASARTLADVLSWQADADPGRVHIILSENDGRERPIRYGELRRQAAEVAAGLRRRGLQRGDAVGLMLRTEADFFSAFFGTILAGGVAVPIYPPFRLDRIEEYAERQVAILRNAEVRTLITFPQAEPVATLLRARGPSLGEVTAVRRVARAGADAPAVRLAPGDPVLIQYTWLHLELTERGHAPSVGGARPQAAGADAVHSPPLAGGTRRLPGGQSIRLSGVPRPFLMRSSASRRSSLVSVSRSTSPPGGRSHQRVGRFLEVQGY
jgi:AMP-binding enzyme